MQSMSSGEARARGSRTLNGALCATALLWFVAADAIASRAAKGLADRFQGEIYEALLRVLFALFLVVFGYAVIDRVARSRGTIAEVLPLPRRTGWWTELGVGAALGWGLAVVAVLPMLLSRNLHVHLGVSWPTVGTGLVGLATLAVVCLLEEVVARGYAFRRLIEAIGESWATLLMSAGFGAALVLGDPPRNVLTALVCGTLLGMLLAIAYLRTHALWVGWGLHFAYRAAAAVLFGLPIVGHAEFSTVVNTYTTGKPWLTGGDYGLDAALLTVLVLLGGIPILFRVTREWAWNYTKVLPVGAGYEVAVAPPAAHVAMEQAAAAKEPALVQILPTTPQRMSKGGPGEQ